MTEILIIEDDPDFRKSLSGLLCERFPRLRVLEAQDWEMALSHLASSCPDLVFTDIRLPGQNGFEVTRRVRMIYPRVPILVLTSHNDPEYREAAFSAGATYFASKHKTSAEEMLAMVSSILGCQ